MARPERLPRPACSFCGRRRDLARPDPHGPAICADCLDAANELVARPPAARRTGRITPRAIVEHLDRHVIGQDCAKRVLAVAVHNHLKRAGLVPVPPGLRPLGPGKANVLLTGPTGCGKTLLVQSLAGWLDLPLHRADATAMTQSGYVGESVDSMIEGLLRAAGNDVERAEAGIVFLDEVDKLAKRPAATGGRDVGGEGVQQSLLRLLEGTRLRVRLPGRQGRAPIAFDTSRVLFVLAGAFVGLREAVDRRRGKGSIGFCAPRGDVSGEVGPGDLQAYGLLPELVGRVPVVAELDPLGEDALVAVLVRPRNALTRQYRHLFGLDGVDLRFAPGALRAIARRALDRGVGARGLRSELEALLLPLMYHLPSEPSVRRVLITAAHVRGEEDPLDQALGASSTEAQALDPDAILPACGSP